MKTDIKNEGFHLEFINETKQSVMDISVSHQVKLVASFVARWLQQTHVEVVQDESGAA